MALPDTKLSMFKKGKSLELFQTFRVDPRLLHESQHEKRK